MGVEFLNRRKKIMIRVGLAVVLLVGITMSLGLIYSPPVEVIKLANGNLTAKVEETGEVRAVNSSDIYALQPGCIAEIPIKEGQTVAAGQVLIKMESLDLQIEKDNLSAQIAQVNEAANQVLATTVDTKFSLEQAQNDLQRSKPLYEAGAVSKADYEKVKAQVETYQNLLSRQNACVDNYQAQASSLSNMMYKVAKKHNELSQMSPISGVVLTVKVKSQQIVPQGALLASVGSPDQLEVKADIIVDDVKNIRVGQKVIITSPVLDRKYLYGNVKEIYPQAEEKPSALGVVQRRVSVIISLDSSANLKPGYEVRVAIETMRHNHVLVLPSEAIRTMGNGDKQVAIVENERVRFRKIDTGISDKYNVEITRGLKAGDMVVRNASASIEEGQRAKPKF